MKKKHPALWLLLIPAQLVLDVGYIVLGALLDSWMFSGSQGQGHGIPFFIMVLPIIGIVCTVIVIIAALVLFFCALHRRDLEQRMQRQNPEL